MNSVFSYFKNYNIWLKNKDYIDLTEEFDSLVKRDYQQNHFSYIKNESESSNLPNVLVFQGRAN